MDGQWIGKATGDTVGRLILDLDEMPDHFRGTARLLVQGEPGIVCEFQTPDKSGSYQLSNIPLAWLPEGQVTLLPKAEIQKLYTETTFPDFANISIEVEGNSAKASWITNIETSGEAILTLAAGNAPSTLMSMANVVSWSAFKEFALRQTPGQFIFRGQP